MHRSICECLKKASVEGQARTCEITREYCYDLHVFINFCISLSAETQPDISCSLPVALIVCVCWPGLDGLIQDECSSAVVV